MFEVILTETCIISLLFSPLTLKRLDMVLVDNFPEYFFVHKYTRGAKCYIAKQCLQRHGSLLQTELPLNKGKHFFLNSSHSEISLFILQGYLLRY